MTTNKLKDLIFRTVQYQGLTYWVCLCDNEEIARAFSLPGVRMKVLTLLKSGWRKK